MKDELGGEKITEFVALIPKTQSYSAHDSDKNKEAKATKKCVVKIKFKFEYYKHFLEATQLENKINQLKKQS